ncbi:MAG TPA: citrate synthase [Vicinamibacteria bacterium]|jgi:citrate synthase|nr:citrate synthase [Vicinamibacteria bacterium]
MSKDSLSITDNRTGKTYEVPIQDGAIKAIDLRQIKTSADDFGLMTYDPAFTNTASCKSRITFIDGDKGILNYRGYPIEQLAEKSDYLETAYLLLHGELPSRAQYEAWVYNITHHTMVHENIKELMGGFRYDAHPMGMLVSTVGALSTFYPQARDIHDAQNRRAQIFRLIAKMPTLAAFAHRHSQGIPFVYPDNELSYSANFLHMMFKMTELKYRVNPVLEKALEVLFILHADHEQNCSTNAMRSVGSSEVDPYSATAAAIAALYGPLHGGANEAVLRMLREIGSKDKIPQFIKEVKTSGGEVRLMGFGHRVYKNYDPRAKIIKKMADQVFEVTGRNPLLDIALELEKIALEDEYFVKRKLYPNVDFYSGLIYQAMGFPLDMFPVLFAIPRTAGWLAQWEEMLLDKDQKIARPRQLYQGPARRDYVPRESRS